MKVIALLCWYDEQPSLLAECVRSLEGIADELIALDGAYEQWPGGRTLSRYDQWLAIARASADLGIRFDVNAPDELWPRPGEVGKRKAMWAAGLDVAELGEDWLFWIDADEVVESFDPDGFLSLEVTLDHVAEVEMVQNDPKPGGGEIRFPIRRLFRALPDLTCQAAHYHVTATVAGGGPITLLGNENYHGELAPARDLTGVLTLRHRKGERSSERERARADYYAVRQASGDELLPPWPPPHPSS